MVVDHIHDNIELGVLMERLNHLTELNSSLESLRIRSVGSLRYAVMERIVTPVVAVVVLDLGKEIADAVSRRRIVGLDIRLGEGLEGSTDSRDRAYSIRASEYALGIIAGGVEINGLALRLIDGREVVDREELDMGHAGIRESLQVLDHGGIGFGQAEVLALVSCRDSLICADSDVAEMCLGDSDGGKILRCSLRTGGHICVPSGRLGLISVKICDKAVLGIGGECE